MAKARNFADLACPQCGSQEEIDIQALVWTRLCEDGTDPDAADRHHESAAEWSDNSAAACAKCGWDGRVADLVSPIFARAKP